MRRSTMEKNERSVAIETFEKYLKEEPDINPLSGHVMDLLGDKIKNMVYDTSSLNEKSKYPSIVDMFLGGKSTLGTEVAAILRYHTTGNGKSDTKIVIRDLINKAQIPDKCVPYNDDRYIVGIYYGGVTIEMYIY
jgi:hypothetical protein